MTEPEPRPQSDRTNGWAITALVAGIGQAILPLVAAVLAVVAGHLALSQIARRGERGRGLAIAGLVLGYSGIAVILVMALVLVQVFRTGF